MGAIKNKSIELLDIIHESLDLFQNTISLTIRGNKFFLSSECGSIDLCVEYILSEVRPRGPHLFIDIKNLDEYSFCEIVERAARGGYSNIYVEGV